MKALEFTDDKVILELTRDEFDDLSDTFDALVQQFEYFDEQILTVSFQDVDKLNNDFYEINGINDDYLLKQNEGKNL